MLELPVVNLDTRRTRFALGKDILLQRVGMVCILDVHSRAGCVPFYFFSCIHSVDEFIFIWCQIRCTTHPCSNRHEVVSLYLMTHFLVENKFEMGGSSRRLPPRSDLTYHQKEERGEETDGREVRNAFWMILKSKEGHIVIFIIYCICICTTRSRTWNDIMPAIDI